MVKELLSRIAAGNGHGEESAYFHGWKAYENDPFHPVNNPSGVIQMGLAENQVINYLLITLLIMTSIFFVNFDFEDLLTFFGQNLQLSFDMVKDWVVKNPAASICTVEGVDHFKDIAIFQDYHGLPAFRNVISYSHPLIHTSTNLQPIKYIYSKQKRMVNQ